MYIYNATCMTDIRDTIIVNLNQPRAGLLRNASAATAPSTAADWGNDYWDAAAKSLLFYEAQWAGSLPVGYRIAWRQPGFVGACGGRADGGSFSGGGAPQAIPFAPSPRLSCVL